MKNEDESLTSSASGCVLSLISIPIGIALKLFVGAKFWGWFVAPVFGLPMPTPATGFGLLLVTAIYYITRNPSDDDRTTLKRGLGSFLSATLSPLFLLLIGYMTVLLIRSGY